MYHSYVRSDHFSAKSTDTRARHRPLTRKEEGVQHRPDHLSHYTLTNNGEVVFLAVGMVLEDCLEELFDISFSGAELCLLTSYYLKFCNCLVIRVGPAGPTLTTLFKASIPFRYYVWAQVGPLPSCYLKSSELGFFRLPGACPGSRPRPSSVGCSRALVAAGVRGERTSLASE